MTASFLPKISLRLLSLGLGLLCFWGVACGQGESRQADYDQMLRDLYLNTVPLVNAKNLHADPTEEYLVLDTRERPEYDVSHIPGARWVGYDDFTMDRLGDIPKDQPILLYCSVGYRSERIGEKLIDRGYESVKNLYGGIFLWSNEHRPVVDTNGNQTQRVHGFDSDWGKWLISAEVVLEPEKENEE